MMEEYRLFPSGKRFVNGLANAYEDNYPPHILMHVLTKEELTQIIKQLNESIQKYWPCQPCYLFGLICAPMTLIPCFPTNYCMEPAEKAAHDYLEQISLKSRFYDRNITFRLSKHRCMCSSYVSIIFPSELLPVTSTSIISSEITPLLMMKTEEEGHGHVSDGIVMNTPGYHRKYM